MATSHAGGISALLWQQDLFNSELDVFFQSSVKEHKTRSIRKSHGGNSNSDRSQQLNSLLPFLFPEDYPELQSAIEEMQFKWSDEDIHSICQGVMNDALFSLIHPKSGNSARDEAIEWLFNDEIYPFSFTHCCLEAGVSPGDLRERIYGELLYARRLYRKTDAAARKARGFGLLGRDSILLNWLENQQWLDEVGKNIDPDNSCGLLEQVVLYVNRLRENISLSQKTATYQQSE